MGNTTNRSMNYEKKIIFIGGTARSGSTLLDLIITNDPRAMSLGEINALFWPTRKHHFDEISRLKKDSVWPIILTAGAKQLYPNLIKKFPRVDIFVDSSKDMFWIKQQNRILNRNKINFRNILIYKDPYEIANSFFKRNQDWRSTWINYHRKYFTLIDESFVISYKDLVNNSSSLKKLCEWIGIKYFEEKLDYWNKEQKPFFGSSTAKYHLKNKKQKNQINNNIIRNPEYRVIKYDKPNYSNIEKTVNIEIENKPIIKKIWSILVRTNLSFIKFNALNTTEAVKFNFIMLIGFYAKYRIRKFKGKIFPENYKPVGNCKIGN